MVGSTLSHYKITAELGRGGMGIVYRATDTKLDRDVAIKVLPAGALASEDDRARFYREARAAAGLNHPNIAAVYGIDEAVPSGAPHGTQPSPFIAMELIEGAPLEDRIKQGPLALEESVAIAAQIASALEAAHAKEIVHRDIKSANVMLAKGGTAKVLDFGLAQTAQSTKLTKMGSTLGTIAYMSPEQAKGELVDNRTDLWSLGVVLYEMIAGRAPYPGEYDKAVIYSILNEDPPPLTGIRTGVPMGLEWIVSKLLAKNAADRYQNAVDLQVDLRTVDLSSMTISRVTASARSVASGTGSGAGSVTGSAQAPAPHSGADSGADVGADSASGTATISGATGTEGNAETARLLEALAQRPASGVMKYILGGIIGAVSVILAWILVAQGPKQPSSPPIRVSDSIAATSAPTYIAISPDGLSVAYVLPDGVHVHNLSSGETHLLGETENTTVVAFSPDSENMLLTKTVSIDRVPVAGGAPLEIVQTTEGSPRAAWGPEGWIIFEDNQQIYKYSESTGERIQITTRDSLAREDDYDWPSMLPDGKTMMATLESIGIPAKIRFVNVESGKVRKTINFAGYKTQYLKLGYLAGIVEGEGLVVVPFDIESLTITGPRRSILSSATVVLTSISETGTIVYSDSDGNLRETTALPETRPAILTFPAFKEFLKIAPGKYSDFRLSPDEKKVVFVKHDADGLSLMREIVVYDLESRLSRAITRRGLVDYPVWKAGEDSVAFLFSEIINGPQELRLRAADGSGDERRLSGGSSRNKEFDFSPDGQTVVRIAEVGLGAGLLRVTDLRTDQSSTIAGEDAAVDIRRPRISPDGNIVVYQRGQDAFATNMDGTGTELNISSGFAEFPQFSDDGRYYFHVSFQGSVLRLDVKKSDTGLLLQPSNKEVAILGANPPYFDVFSDGQRAIVGELVTSQDPLSPDSTSVTSFPLHFVFNWFEELK